jgi:hypothetical protein
VEEWVWRGTSLGTRLASFSLVSCPEVIIWDIMATSNLKKPTIIGLYGISESGKINPARKS